MHARFCNRLAMVLGAALVVTGLAMPFLLSADDGFATDGYLKEERNGCLVVAEHDGKERVLTGAINGLQAQDHVRLYGRPVRGAECNHFRTPAYEVTEVQTIWADDRHKTTYYDHLKDGPFGRWVRRHHG
jgi:hypothetical protein